MHKLSFLTPFYLDQNKPTASLVQFAQQASLSSFEPVLFDFIKVFSQSLLKESQYKQYPELVALGFWLRSSNLKSKLKEVGYKYLNASEPSGQASNEYKALGCVVHFTPANVDTMFIYSWIASLLLGNTNIVRVASQDSQSKVMLLELLNRLFNQPEFKQISERNVFISYDKQSNFTDELSAIADARLIWGGDKSVGLIKQSPSKNTCRDLSFADKYSLSLVNLSEIKESGENYAELLWRDTQAFYQQACSSPRVLFFVGDSSEDNTSLLKDIFAKVNHLAKNDMENWQDDTRVNEHLVTLQSLSIQSYIGENAIIQLDQISAAFVAPITQKTMSQHKGNGLYYVAIADSLEQVMDWLVHSSLENECAIAEKVQTISIFGFDKKDINNIASASLGQTSFRVQDQGQALDFSFKWDGYNLLESLGQ